MQKTWWNEPEQGFMPGAEALGRWLILSIFPPLFTFFLAFLESTTCNPHPPSASCKNAISNQKQNPTEQIEKKFDEGKLRELFKLKKTLFESKWKFYFYSKQKCSIPNYSEPIQKTFCISFNENCRKLIWFYSIQSKESTWINQMSE